MAISPALFNIYMEKFIIEFRKSFADKLGTPEHLLYADDLALITTYIRLEETIKNL